MTTKLDRGSFFGHIHPEFKRDRLLFMGPLGALFTDDEVRTFSGGKIVDFKLAPGVLLRRQAAMGVADLYLFLLISEPCSAGVLRGKVALVERIGSRRIGQRSLHQVTAELRRQVMTDIHARVYGDKSQVELRRSLAAYWPEQST
jgi:hypothetical protein